MSGYVSYGGWSEDNKNFTPSPPRRAPILNGRHAWLARGPLTQQRKREKEMGPYWKSR